jgi:tetratricopeptide (TPR) repeat protein
MGRFRTAFLGAALLALTVIAYTPVWKNSLVDFDDELYITTNPHVMRGLTWSGVEWAFTNYHGRYWQPISWLSLQLDVQLVQFYPARSRDEKLPAVIHGQNLFWHCASALLLFLLWQRLTGATWCAFLVAALFALHPMHVESVAWAAERKDVLSVFFGILTLWAYVGYVQRPSWIRYVATVSVFALSLMSKPMLLTLPFVLLLLDYWPLRRDQPARSASEDPSLALRASPPGGSAPWGRLLLEKVPLLLLAAGSGVVTMLTREQTGSVVSLSVLPLSARLANAAAGYGWYLTHTFWPANLGALYPHPGRSWSILSVVGGLAALLAVTALAAWQVRRRRWLIVGWLWFVGTLLPVIGLAQGGEQAWADRFSYWPHVGLFVMVVWGMSELAERWRVSAWLCGAAGALALGCLTAQTWIQVGYWRDSFTLWTRAAAVTTDNDVAQLHLGYYHLHQDVPEKAAIHFAEAVRINPNSGEFQGFLGAVLLSLGKVKEASGHLQRAVQLNPESADAWHNLGMARLRLHEPLAAAACFRKVLQLRSDPAQTRPRAEASVGLGLALLEMGQRSDAREAFEAALALDRKQAEAWHGLGKASLAEGRLDEAVEAIGKAVQHAPGLADAFSDLGVALGRQGQWAKAVAAHRTAVRLQDRGGELRDKMAGSTTTRDMAPNLVVYCCRLAYAQNQLGSPEAAAKSYAVAFRRDPNWPDKFAAQAWKLATAADANRRDPRLAFELASQAAQAAEDPPAATLDALAAAHAALGQFSEAVQAAKRALKTATDSGDSNLSQSIQEHLQHYQKGECIRAEAP